MAKANHKKSKKDNQFNAENEIIIGVTTKPKENVRVESKKTTRTNNKRKNTTKKKTINKKEKISRNTVNRQVKKEETIKKKNRKKIILSIIILFFIAFGGMVYYLTTPVFNIVNIEVYGNEKNSVETYISLSKIELNMTNIFGIKSKNVQKNIKENAYVQDVVIKRKLPNTIQINITERKTVFQSAYSSEYLYIDNQGYILELNEEKQNVPVLKGLSSIDEGVQAGKRLNKENLQKLNTVLKITNYCTYNSIDNKITSIDATDIENYIIYFGKDKKTVYLGNASNLSERLSLLKTILKNEKGKEGEIFMNGDINESKVYFREKVK